MIVVKPPHLSAWLIAFAALLVGSFGVVCPTSADEIPATLRPNWSILDFYPADIPVWVSAKQAFDEKGNLIPSLFRPEKLRRLKHILEVPKDPATGCSKVLWIEQSYVNPPDRGSLSRAVATSEMVLWGKVVASEVGFERGDFGQLMLVQPIEQMKPRGKAAGRSYFIFVPAGRLRFAGYDICKEDPRVVVPEIGEEVVLFPKEAPSGETYLNLEYDGSMLVFGADGSVRWPDVMQRDSVRHSGDAKNKSDVLDELRTAARLSP